MTLTEMAKSGRITADEHRPIRQIMIAVPMVCHGQIWPKFGVKPPIPVDRILPPCGQCGEPATWLDAGVDLSALCSSCYLLRSDGQRLPLDCYQDMAFCEPAAYA